MSFSFFQRLKFLCATKIFARSEQVKQHNLSFKNKFKIYFYRRLYKKKCPNKNDMMEEKDVVHKKTYQINCLEQQYSLALWCLAIVDYYYFSSTNWLMLHQDLTNTHCYNVILSIYFGLGKQNFFSIQFLFFILFYIVIYCLNLFFWLNFVYFYFF